MWGSRPLPELIAASSGVNGRERRVSTTTAEGCYPYRMSWWVSFFIAAVLVAVARLLFPNVDLRRNVLATGALIVVCLLVERIVNKYITRRAKR